MRRKSLAASSAKKGLVGALSTPRPWASWPVAARKAARDFWALYCQSARVAGAAAAVR